MLSRSAAPQDKGVWTPISGIGKPLEELDRVPFQKWARAQYGECLVTQKEPHTRRLHTVERSTRLNSNRMKYEVTFDDPGAYTKPWTASFDLRRNNGTELYECICRDANEAGDLPVGDGGTSVRRSSRITP